MKMSFFKAKKWMAFFFSGLLPVATTVLATIFVKDVIIGVAFGIIMTILMVWLGSILISHPFISLAEAEGVIALTMDSTGVITPFILKVDPPFIKGKIGKHEMESIFDRDAVSYMVVPEKGTLENDENEIVLRLQKREVKNAMFSLQGVPTLIFNTHLDSFMTKEMLSNLETKTFARHQILYLNHKTKELTSTVRDFARYVVELTRPATPLFEQGWFKALLLILVLGAVAWMAGPALLEALGAGATATGKLASTPALQVRP